MPQKPAVYGKRSRAYYNPADIFASPQHIKRQTWAPFSIAEDEDRSPKAAIPKKKEAEKEKSPRRRRVLGERSHNAGLTPEVPRLKKDRARVGKREESETRAGGGFVARQKDQDDTDDFPPQEPPADSPNEEPKPKDEENPANPALETPTEPPTKKDAPTEDLEEPMAIVTIPTPMDQTEASGAKEDNPTSPPDPYTTHASTLLSQTSHPITTFSTWASDLSTHFHLSKIAEASFGEVYRLSLTPDLASDPTLPLTSGESVLKVIALTPPPSTLPTSKRDRARALKKAEAMSKPADVASEVQLLQRLRSIPGFTNFRDVRVLQGRPSQPFVEAFRAFNLAQKKAKKDVSIFPDPARKSNYSEDQLWAVIEMQDAGTDLEKLLAQGKCRDVWGVWDVFWQVVLALAKGEEEAEFEHRDLHLGNICVRAPNPSASSTSIDPTKKLGFTGAEATLIDYTISRCSMPPPSTSTSPTKQHQGSTAFIDLASDPHIFEGDSAEEYQYDIYRYMRSSIYYNSPYNEFPSETSAAPVDRTWEDFCPQTNLLWLHYVLYMMLEALSWPSSTKPPAKKRREERRKWERSVQLETVLLQVQDLLDPGVLGAEGSLCKSGDLVGVALEQGWLGEKDVVGDVWDDGGDQEWGGCNVEDELAAKLGQLALEQQAGAGDENAVVMSDAKGTRKTGRK